MRTKKLPAVALPPMKESATQEKSGARYIDLSSDIGFKIAFGNPDMPDLIKGLLQALLPEREIAEIEFLDGQIKPEEIIDKRVCFDIRCKEKDGRSFIVEMQKENYDYMVDRLVVYSGDPLKRLLKAGEDYSKIQPLYIICISNFIFKFDGDDEESRRQLVRTAKIHLDDTKEILSNKLNFIFLQLPVVKNLADGQSFLEQWAYAVRHCVTMKEKPQKLSSPYFDTMFKAADRKYINPLQLEIYDYMIRDAVQIKAEKDFAIREAIEETTEKVSRANRIEIAKALKKAHVADEIIISSTGITAQQLKSL